MGKQEGACMGEGLGDGGGASQRRERAERDALINVRVQFPGRDKLLSMVLGQGIIDENQQVLELIDRIGGQSLSAEQFVDIWIEVFKGSQDLYKIMELFELSQPFQQQAWSILSGKLLDYYPSTR